LAAYIQPFVRLKTKRVLTH